MKVIKIELEKFLDTMFIDLDLRDFLSIACEISKKRGEFLYFAGGVVRDYLLKTIFQKKIPKIKDLDLVLQGDLKAFLKELLKKVKGEILFESQFLTYKVKIDLEGKEFLVDFITARKEFYEDVADLPKVFPSDFKDDILRRDFTINALIIGLSPPYEEFLIDLVDGLRDLEKGLIKPLHLNSFIDDPTRIFRGVRYKVRFDFKFAEEFFSALKRCFEKSALKKLSGTRFANELKLYLNKEPEENLKYLLKETFDLQIFEKGDLKVDKTNFDLVVSLLKKFKKELSTKEKEKFFLLGIVDPQFLEKACFQLGFTEPEAKEFKKHLELVKNFLKAWETLSLWEKIKIFEKIPIFYLLTLSVYFPEIKKDTVKFLKEYKNIKPELTGDDLKNLGVKEGKNIGMLLELIRRKRIEGEIRTKEEEKSLVVQFLLDENRKFN